MHARTIAVDGRAVRILEAAPERQVGDPVLLIHGIGGWAENWYETLPALAAAGRRALAADLPGFGESEAWPGSRYFDPREPFYGRFVARLLDALGLERAHLVGSSMGGAIAFIAAIHSPQRARSVVLVAPGGLGPEMPLYLRLGTLPFSELLARLPAPRFLQRSALESCFHDPARVPDRLAAELERYGPRSLPEALRVLRTVGTLRGVRPGLRRAWLARAHEYSGPVLIVWGREDRVLRPAEAEAVRDLAPRAELRMIEGAGHLPMIERPEEFQAIVLPFLDDAEAA